MEARAFAGGGMRELSLFTGAGGGLLGTHLLGWEPIGYVEWNSYCQQVIAARIQDGFLPVAPIFTDVREFVQSGAAGQYRGIADVVSAGFPCQPFSVAGKQAGAGDERNMWPATRDVIRVVRPAFAWLENVTGLLATGYCERIFADLASLGFDAEWGVFSAAGSGAPHLRERVFIAANDRRQRIQRNIKLPVCGVARFPWGKDGRGPANWAERSGISEPAIRRVGNGLAYYVDRATAIGNGQVPAVVERAWRELAA